MGVTLKQRPPLGGLAPAAEAYGVINFSILYIIEYFQALVKAFFKINNMLQYAGHFGSTIEPIKRMVSVRLSRMTKKKGRSISM